MKSWQLLSEGIENLRPIEQAVPAPKEGQVLVRTGAVSLNFRDWDIVAGTYHTKMPPPFVPASDLAGTIVAVGKGVTRWKEGDRVTSLFRPLWLDGELTKEVSPSLGGPLPGVLSEYVLFSEQSLVQTPTYLSDQEASTLPIAALTAWVGLAEEGRLQPEQTVVLQGTGGVSLFGLQIAKAFGARAIVTSGKQEKLERLKGLGADLGIHTATTPEWQQTVTEFTAGQGTDQILEIAGGRNLARSIQALRIGGVIVVIGYLDGRETTIPIAPLLVKRIRIQGISVGHRAAFERMLTFFSEHQLRPVIDKVYSLDETPAAFEHLGRGAFGKVVIQF